MSVKKLKEITASAIYKDIVFSLSSVNVMKSKEPRSVINKTREVVESQSGNWSVESNGEAAAKKKVKLAIQAAVADSVKKRLDEYLVGTFRHIREELWEEYNKQPGDENRPDLCLFLGCILDDDFNKLQFNPRNLPPVLFNKQGNFYLIELVEIVSKHCPSLQEISFVIKTPQLPRSAEALWAKSFAGLKRLTTLRLDWSTPSNCISFFTHLGSSCSKLQKLKLRRLPFKLDQQLALVLGPRLQLLPRSVKETIDTKKWLRFQFHNDHTTAICRSLNYLSSKISGSNEKIVSECFLLRHFSQLKEFPVLSSDSSNSNATSLNFIASVFHKMLSLPIETAEAEVFGRGLNLKWDTNASPPQTQKISKSSYLMVIIREILESVIAMCPHLKRFNVSFGNSLPVADSPNLALNALRNLQSILAGGLTKVDTLGLHVFDSHYRAAVLASLGGQLKSLKLYQCHEIDLVAELAPCTQLEELEIDVCRLKSTPNLVENVAFLSALKKLNISFSRGYLPQLLSLPLPSLTELHLYVRHSDLDDGTVSDWIKLLRLYPNLRALSLISCPCKRLMLDDIRVIITQLPCIESICFPQEEYQTKEEEQLYKELVVELTQLPSPITLEFVKRPPKIDQ